MAPSALYTWFKPPFIVTLSSTMSRFISSGEEPDKTIVTVDGLRDLLFIAIIYGYHCAYYRVVTLPRLV